MRPLIIERPDLQTAAQRLGYVSLTLVCWFVWLYLFVPLLSLAAWTFGGALVYEHLISELSNPEVRRQLGFYAKGIVVMYALYLSWAAYNYRRWHGVNRRGPPVPVSDGELAEKFRVSTSRIHQLRAAAISTVSADELTHMFDAAEEDLLAALDVEEDFAAEHDEAA